MSNKKAEQEISALITGITIIGLALPVVLTSFMSQYSHIIEYLTQIGIIEASDRVVLRIYSNSGLDAGRLMIVFGLFLIQITGVIKIVEIKSRKNKMGMTSYEKVTHR